MKKSFVIVIIIFLAGAGAFWYFRQPAGGAGGSPSASVPSLTQTYTDNVLHFSFNYPKDYSVREIQGESDARTLVIENSSTNSGIQIIITPDYPDPSITVETIREAIPDMKIENPQSFPVGANSGLTFQSDNPAFDGASREVWFAYNGYLYQISAYAKDDPLLAAIFATWKLE